MSEGNQSSTSAGRGATPGDVQPQFDRYGNPRWPYLNLFSWRQLNFKCRQCDWSGSGMQAEIGEVDEEITELVCPDCDAYMAALSHLVEIPGVPNE